MAKKESAEALAQDLQRLTGLHDELKSGIASIEREVALLEERDMECARRTFRGEDLRKERTKLQETRTAKLAALDVARRDLAILEAELARVEAEHARAARAAEEAAVPRLATALEAATAALTGTIREALQEPAARLQQLEVRHADLGRRWEALYDRDYTGGSGLTRLGHAVRALQATLEAIGGPR